MEKSNVFIIYFSYILPTISFFISSEHNNFVDKILYFYNSINIHDSFSWNIDFIYLLIEIKSTTVSSNL